jgi:NAD(P)-dependent dehydrogenase (short-subunit alcohol dehydrogenase family)
MIAAKSLAGQSGIVTGGASGIGRAIAESLVAAGARVVIADIADENARRIAAALGDEHCMAVCADVTRESDIERCIESAIARFGALEFLVNCAAGSGSLGPIENLTLAEYRTTMDVLLTGPFLALKYATPYFKRRGTGCVVNIASLAGLFGVGPGLVYTVAKHGLIGLTRAAADQLAPFNVRVNAVAPGWIMTPMHHPSFADIPATDRDQAMRRQFSKKQPLRRPGEPDDIACAVLYLLGDGARFVTGQTLVVDGGLTAVTRAFDETRPSDPHGDT